MIFSDCHPLLNLVGRACTRVSRASSGFAYFQEGAKQKGAFLLSDYSSIHFIDTHWSLECYSSLLKQNGMMIESIVEPRPVKMDPRKRLRDYQIPEYIILQCRKG